MEADFDRFYDKDLARLIWVDEWPASMLWARVTGLPEDSAFVRKLTLGHTSLHELVAQVRDAVTTTAHGYRWEGKPENYQRPAEAKAEAERVVHLSDRSKVAEIKRFFGTPR